MASMETETVKGLLGAPSAKVDARQNLTFMLAMTCISRLRREEAGDEESCWQLRFPPTKFLIRDTTCIDGRTESATLLERRDQATFE